MKFLDLSHDRRFIICEIDKIPDLNKDELQIIPLLKRKKWEGNAGLFAKKRQSFHSSYLLRVRYCTICFPSRCFTALWISPWSPPCVSWSFQIGFLPVSHILSLNVSIFLPLVSAAYVQLFVKQFKILHLLSGNTSPRSSTIYF